MEHVCFCFTELSPVVLEMISLDTDKIFHIKEKDVAPAVVVVVAAVMMMMIM